MAMHAVWSGFGKKVGTLVALAALASLPSSAQRPAAGVGRIEGVVYTEVGSTPLRRVHVTLAPADPGALALSTETDDKGNFQIRDIAPGRYSLTASRDGYLDTSVFLRAGYRMPSTFNVAARDSMTDVVFRMRPWGVIVGHVRYDDGEPAVGVRVELYREFHQRGKTVYRAVAALATNDRGEYRAFNLPAADYCVAGVYERGSDQPKLDNQGRELPASGFTTSFYPGTTRLAEAVKVRVGIGGEVGPIDVFLRSVRKATLHGQVTSGATGTKLTNAAILMQRLDAHNSGVLPFTVRATYDRDRNFEIRDIAPGTYMLFAQVTEAQKTLTTQVPVNITGDTDGIELFLRPDAAWSLTTRLDPSRTAGPRSTRVYFEPRGEQGAIVQTTNGTFALRPEETYDLMVDNLPDDQYIAAVNANGSDVLASGIQGTMATREPLEIVIDTRGGKVGGRVFGPEGDVWTGAAVVLIPEPAKGRLQAYRLANADQYGIFQFRGVPPGRYTLAAWMEDPPCDIYDPEGLQGCRDTGMTLDVTQSSSQTFDFQVRAPRR